MLGRIKFVYLLHKTVLAPQLLLFALLVFIACKHLGATPLQITVLATARPLSSILSFYTGIQTVRQTRSWLIALALASALPCLLFVYVQNVWYLTAVYLLFLIASKAVNPPLIQAIKEGCAPDEKSRIFALGNSIYYCANIALPLLFSFVLDRNPDHWPYLFLATGVLQLISVFLFASVSLPQSVQKEIRPLRDSWNLLLRKPRYLQFHAMLFVGGIGLLLLRPVLPLFFKEELNITYTQIALVYSVCKGLSYLASLPFWTRLCNARSLFFSGSVVKGLAAGYILCIFLGQLGYPWLIPAFCFYGAMRGGSELCWTLSGPVFSEKEDSTLFSSLNLLIGGIRGILFPFSGMALYELGGMNTLFLVALIPTLAGVAYGLRMDSYDELRISKRV